MKLRPAANDANRLDDALFAPLARFAAGPDLIAVEIYEQNQETQ
jgi:hypothetical protein